MGISPATQIKVQATVSNAKLLMSRAPRAGRGKGRHQNPDSGARAKRGEGRSVSPAKIRTGAVSERATRGGVCRPPPCNRRKFRVGRERFPFRAALTARASALQASARPSLIPLRICIVHAGEARGVFDPAPDNGKGHDRSELTFSARLATLHSIAKKCLNKERNATHGAIFGAGARAPSPVGTVAALAMEID